MVEPEQILWALLGPQHCDWRVTGEDLADLLFLGRFGTYDLYCWSNLNDAYAYNGNGWIHLNELHASGAHAEVARRKTLLTTP